jgi:hypothetical protein
MRRATFVLRIMTILRTSPLSDSRKFATASNAQATAKVHPWSYIQPVGGGAIMTIAGGPVATLACTRSVGLIGAGVLQGSDPAGRAARPTTAGGAALLVALIHPSAWNKNSANFGGRGFSEVRTIGGPNLGMLQPLAVGGHAYWETGSCSF